MAYVPLSKAQMLSFFFTCKEIYLLFYAKQRVKFTLQNLVAPLNSTHVHNQITKYVTRQIF